MDLNHFPFFVFRTYGVADGDVLRMLYCLRDPCLYWAVDHGTQMWGIWDHKDTEIPDAAGRKSLTDISTAGDRHEGYLNICHIVQRRLLRGVVNAITWVTGNQVQVEVTKTMAHAVRVANQGYKARGIKPPAIPDDYILAEWNESLPIQHLTMDDIWWSLENRGKHLVDQALASG